MCFSTNQFFGCLNFYLENTNSDSTMIAFKSEKERFVIKLLYIFTREPESLIWDELFSYPENSSMACAFLFSLAITHKRQRCLVYRKSNKKNLFQ